MHGCLSFAQLSYFLYVSEMPLIVFLSFLPQPFFLMLLQNKKQKMQFLQVKLGYLMILQKRCKKFE